MEDKYQHYWKLKKRKDEYAESLDELLQPKPINIHGVSGGMALVIFLVIFMSGYGTLLIGALVWNLSGGVA